MSNSLIGRDGRIWIVLLFVALAFLLCSFLHRIRQPWVEEDNYSGALYSQAAHNNLRAGLLVTGGVPATMYFGPLPIPADGYYAHHPILLPLLVTAAFAALGEMEWAARLVPIACSIASAFFLWLLLRDTINRRAAALTVAVFVTLPMQLHYGDMVDYEPCLVAWMLGALFCLHRWRTRAVWPWKFLGVLCCFCALWTDWPGYLFVVVLSISLLMRRDRADSLLAFVLLGLAFFSGIGFLLLIRRVDPRAWQNLWIAVTMRFGNGLAAGSSPIEQMKNVHFTATEWARQIVRSFGQDYLFFTWPLTIVGALFCLGNRQGDGVRSLNWALLLMALTGIPYMALLRNWSFIHDWASFVIIGDVAILGGLGLEAFLTWCDRRTAVPFARSLGVGLVLGLLGWLSWTGTLRAEEQRSQLLMLDGVSAEPTNIIPDLGRYLSMTFAPDTTILCNFDPYYSTLGYYAQRALRTNLRTPDEWNDARSDSPRVGGTVWLADPMSVQIVKTMPQDEIDTIEIDGVAFLVWKPTR
jgi:4-amino-4-deoxy-L-arabinose transferase-like glycosyltransferase